jgi:hypothetical protein
MTMRVVKSVPPAVTVYRDPWLDELLDGQLRHLEMQDWRRRYKNRRSATSAIRQAASKRGVEVTIAVRDYDLYVQGITTAQPIKKATRQPPTKRASTSSNGTAKAPIHAPSKRAPK